MRRVYFASFAAFASSEIAYFLRQRERVYGKIRDMTLPAAKHRHTVEEYLRLERDALDKHEFHDGEILAMSGGTARHSLICMNFGAALNARLKGKPCRVYDSNLRVRATIDRYVYADNTVICGPVEYDLADPYIETVTNPKVIVEVLSPSTERYDRTTKFDLYRKVAAMEEYVLIYQSEPRIEVFARKPDGTWSVDVAAGMSAVAKLRSINVDLSCGRCICQR
jgi:Uma2 family endonuclease